MLASCTAAPSECSAFSVCLHLLINSALTGNSPLVTPVLHFQSLLPVAHTAHTTVILSLMAADKRLTDRQRKLVGYEKERVW